MFSFNLHAAHFYFLGKLHKGNEVRVWIVDVDVNETYGNDTFLHNITNGFCSYNIATLFF